MPLTIRLLATVVTTLLVLIHTDALAQQQADPWITYEVRDGRGTGKHVVLIAGDQEYRSEEVLPMLAKILALRHGFTCTVLFPIDRETGEVDPSQLQNVPGLHHLETADLMVLFSRFLELPPEQMDYIVNYTESGRPIIGIRTATHAFRYQDADSPYAKYSWRSEVAGWEGGYGRRVFGEMWYAHLGEPRRQSTRGLVNGIYEERPILNGIGTMWGPSDVYHIDEIQGDEEVLVYGQLLDGMQATSPPDLEKPIVPIAWTKTYASESGTESRVFYTSLGLGADFEDESARRLLVNAVYWATEMEDRIPERADVRFVDPYDPAPRDVDKHKTGLKPSDFEIESSR